MVHFPPKRKARLSLDMAPLLDVVFLLLLFFMLTSSFTSPAIALKLPEGKSGRTTGKQPVVISADSDGDLYVNHRSVTLDGLEDAVRQALAGLDRKEVRFRGDRDSRLGLFVSVMDRARAAGATAIHVEHTGPKGSR